MADYTLERNARRCRIVLAGDFTATLIPSLQAALKEQLAQGLDELVFDLANTAMLDSSGIGLLIAAYNSLGRQQGRVRVQNASSDILQLLQTMRLTTRLQVTGRSTQ